MGSMALGISLEGFKAVVYYERHDFMLVAADAIGNHINQLERISHGEFKPNVILRTVVADGGPFYSGPTHSQDLTEVFRKLVDFPILEPNTPDEALKDYKRAELYDGPIMIVERKSCYDGKTPTTTKSL
jgi:pyruvate/2-oxoglutarate/acetoin dehydrogenase E1 component